VPVDIGELARKHGPRCVEVIAAMLTDGDRKIRLAAATALLDRGFGKPNQQVNVAGAAGALELHLVAARVVSGELLESITAPTIEHEAPPVDLLDAPTPTE
jgi:hypothetical protein